MIDAVRCPLIRNSTPGPMHAVPTPAIAQS